MSSANCTHEVDGKQTFILTGKVVNNQREWICNLCGLLHLATPEEEAVGRFFVDGLVKPVKHLAHPGPELFEHAFKYFAQEKIEVKQKRVRRVSSTGGVIYVPKRYIGCVATVIFWLDEEME